MKKIIEDEIKKYYADTNFTVRKLADNLNLNQSYLREIIQEQFRMSPNELIESFRLDKSVSLLLITTNIYKISIQVGYSHSRAYRRAFKNRFSISPMEFRKKIKENLIKTLEMSLINNFGN